MNKSITNHTAEINIKAIQILTDLNIEPTQENIKLLHKHLSNIIQLTSPNQYLNYINTITTSIPFNHHFND